MPPEVLEAVVRPLTFGEKAVGINFNPGGHNEVEKVKRMFADIIDVCNDSRNNVSAGGDVKRMYSEAITNAQTAQMWAVKAITWKE